MVPHSPLLEPICNRFIELYGEEAGRQCCERLSLMIGRYGVGFESRPATEQWSERDAFLITYGDMVQQEGERPLVTLGRFVNDYFAGAVNTVHILPFFPYSSDDGFSVIDYRVVDPDLGTWTDIQQLGKRFRLMFDLVLNHCSRESLWFKQYQAGISPGRQFFIEVDPATDLSDVVRPRALPLLTKTYTRRGPRHVWTTFSADQIDLDFSNPDVFFEFLDILFFYISQGASVIRLDAIAYLWKEIGTSCIHHPKTHLVVKLYRDILDIVAPNVIILTETNVPHEENVSYLGDGDEAHMIYQFSLPPLLLHALQTGNGRYLTEWAAGLGGLPAGCTVLNFTASHDGIGVRPLEGILPDAEFQALLDRIPARGGRISTKENSDGSESPYELNITYLDALTDPEDGNSDLGMERFLSSQTVAMALRGVPAAYFHSLVGTRNYEQGVAETGRARTINRRKWQDQALRQELDDRTSEAARICREYVRRLRIRSEHPAFHPDGPQRVLDANEEAVFAFERTAPEDGERVVVVNNMSGKVVTVDIESAAGRAVRRGRVDDLIAGSVVELSGGTLDLMPYQCSWLKVD